MRKSSTK
jgi:N4-(beta-N-acetylglucosaminyl)-L-asparaginase